MMTSPTLPQPSAEAQDHDDIHFCLRCRQTVVGLDEYVQHRRSGCGPVQAKYASREPPPPPPRQDGLKAADFFSQLELRSSAQGCRAEVVAPQEPPPPQPPQPPRSGMLTRSKSSGPRKRLGVGDVAPKPRRPTLRVRGGGTTKRQGRGRRVTPPSDQDARLQDSEDDVEEDEEDDSWRYPPRTHTGGKWRPEPLVSSSPPPNAGGKWRPEPLVSSSPPPSAGGKWRPEPLVSSSPPPSAGGKWRPEPLVSSSPPPSAGGKWRPEPLVSSSPPPNAGGKWGPPPSYTGGKWKPYSPVAPEHGHADEGAGLGDGVQEEHGERREGEDEAGELHDQGKGQDDDVTPGEGQDEQGDEDHPKEQEPQDVDVQAFPPPDHTRGKWAPGMANKVRAVLLGTCSSTSPASVRKSGSTVQYWCGSCNRRLASSKMFERHLQSDLHFRRTLPERQLDMGMGRNHSPERERPRSKARLLPALKKRKTLSPTIGQSDASSAKGTAGPDRQEQPQGKDQGHRRDRQLGQGRRQGHGERCPVCRARVHRHQMGKHLVSHFHWRSTRSTAVGSVAADLILDNIEAMVRQSPFQCGLCKFYCNTSATFRQHWASDWHRQTDRKAAGEAGQYWCSPCEVGCSTTEGMEAHLWSEAHREVEAAVNRSVAVVVSRRTELRCSAPGCEAAFRYNIQLARHERLYDHRGAPGTASTSTASDRYQARFRCAHCGVLRRSRLALQKHKLKLHPQAAGGYFCGVCGVDFASADAAAEHRLSQQHRDAVRDRRLSRLQGRGSDPRRALRKCPHCRVPCPGLSALRRHLEAVHPELKHRCALCGLAFTLPQEVSRHHRQVHGPAPEQVHDPGVDPGADEPGPPFVCPPCSFSTDSRAEMAFHKVLHGPPELVAHPGPEDGGGDAPDTTTPRYRCPMCSRLFRKQALRTHLHVHTGERPFRCAHCDKGFGRKDSCVTHELTAHPREQVPAEQVDEERRLQDAISSIVDLSMKTSTNATPASGAPARTSAGAAAADENRDSRERKHLCDVCGKCFFNKTTLRQHQVSLHGVKPLACSWPGCIIRARSAAELRAHAKTHTGEEGGFECPTCRFRARTKQLLKRHEKIHSGEKPFKCEHCDFATRVSSHLTRHRRVHSGAKPFRCPHCDYRCNNQENLRKHVLQTNKHPGKCLYECRFCAESAGQDEDHVQDHEDAVFATNQASDFRTHLARAHPDKFHNLSSAASYVSGIYDKESDPGPGQPLDYAVRMPKPRGTRAKQGKAKSAKTTRAPRRTTLAIAEPATEPVEEDLPTSLLPKHALLDADLFPVVVADLDQDQDVVYVQLVDHALEDDVHIEVLED